MMTRFETLKTKSPKEFLRTVGLPLEKFLAVVEKVNKYMESEKESNPLKRRGQKSKDLSLDDKVLLTLYYMRHYPTFVELGKQFGICESYANKLYHQFLDILIQVLDMPDPKQLLNPETEMIAIDVAEQPIERPQQNQKAYYSGKKNNIP